MVNRLNIAVLLGAIILLFGGVTVASASTEITHLVLDGGANVSADEGDTIEAELTYDLTAGDDAESASYEIVGTGLPKTCVNIADRIESGTFKAAFDIDTTGATQGSNYDVRVIVYGTNGDGANQTCEDGGDDTMTFSDKVTINDEGDSDSGSGNTGSESQLDKLIKLITLWLAGQQTPPVPPVPSKCSQLASASVTTAGLQSFLIANGETIPAIQYGGAAYGYYGSQTTAAVSSFKAKNSCL